MLVFVAIRFCTRFSSFSSAFSRLKIDDTQKIHAWYALDEILSSVVFLLHLSKIECYSSIQKLFENWNDLNILLFES